MMVMSQRFESAGRFSVTHFNESRRTVPLTQTENAHL